MLKRLAVAAFVVMMLSSCAFAQFKMAAVSSPPEIQTPPGATLVTEINISDQDVLGMIKQAIPAFAQASAGAKGSWGDTLKNIDLNTLAEAIEDVRGVRATQFKLGAGAAPDKILTFYQGQLDPADGWSRILYDTSMVKNGVVAVYSRGGQDFFAVSVDAGKQTAFVVRTVGFVNVPKLAAWAGKSARFFMEAKDRAVAAASAAKSQTAPKPATKKAPLKSKK